MMTKDDLFCFTAVSRIFNILQQLLEVGGNEIPGEYNIGPGSENEFVMPPMTCFIIILIVSTYHICNDNRRDETKRQRTRTKCQNDGDHHYGILTRCIDTL